MFRPETDLFTLPYLNGLPGYETANKDSVDSLFRGFFNYYSTEVDFTAVAPSVRTGRLLAIRECEEHIRATGAPGRGQWDAYICIEEPFDRFDLDRKLRHGCERTVLFFSTEQTRRERS